jgi:hypothetical protein
MRLRAQVELLADENDPELRRAGTKTLLRRLDQLDRLVGDMLTLAAAEGGQLVVAQRSISIRSSKISAATYGSTANDSSRWRRWPAR